jgi:hypothetical protein
MIAVRRATPSLRADTPMRALRFAEPALLGITRGDSFVALFNLSAQPVTVALPTAFTGSKWHDLLGEDDHDIALPLILQPYARHWLDSE